MKVSNELRNALNAFEACHLNFQAAQTRLESAKESAQEANKDLQDATNDVLGAAPMEEDEECFVEYGGQIFKIWKFGASRGVVMLNVISGD